MFACFFKSNSLSLHRFLFFHFFSQGWNNLGWNNPNARTPSLDALRKDGVAFTQHYVYKYCSPTRFVMLPAS